MAMSVPEPVGADADRGWATPACRALAEAILASHRRWTGCSLLPSAADDPARALYEAEAVVLAHDGGQDPRFTYANRAAQALWERPWAGFIGLPSRLSAEPDERAQRQLLLDRTARDGVADGYRGVRIASSGRRFWIEEARLWNLLDGQGRRIGQAARFTQWRYC
jgi:hypothetical protein